MHKKEGSTVKMTKLFMILTVSVLLFSGCAERGSTVQPIPKALTENSQKSTKTLETNDEKETGVATSMTQNNPESLNTQEVLSSTMILIIGILILL